MDFDEDPFTVAIRDGIAILSWPDGTKRGVPLRAFRIAHARAAKALAEYDARLAKVVPLPKKR